MASPQTEQGHIRIANELWNEILRRDFSKRQQNLILFLWRLSYGTGQKDCIIDKFNTLELTGMYKQDVKKELKYLRECAVLNWNENDMVFSINKNYKLWQVSPNKNWDSEKFKELIHQNISRKKVSKTLTSVDDSKHEEVSKTLTYKSKTVSKTLTTKLVKHLLSHRLNLSGARLESIPKDIIKDIKDIDIKDNNNNAHTFFEKNISPLSPHVIDQITDWLDLLPEEVVVFSMKLAVESNKRSIAYCNKVLAGWKNEGVKNLADAERENQEFKDRNSNVRHFKPVKEEAEDDGYDYGF